MSLLARPWASGRSLTMISPGTKRLGHVVSAQTMIVQTSSRAIAAGSRLMLMPFPKAVQQPPYPPNRPARADPHTKLLYLKYLAKARPKVAPSGSAPQALSLS